MGKECQFCNKSFATPSSLTYHQKTAKYCLKLRGQKTVYTCPVCEAQLSDKRYYEKHIEKCGTPEMVKELEKKVAQKDKNLEEKDRIIAERNTTIKELRNVIESLQDQIGDLQRSVENIAIQGVKKPTTTNILNLMDMSDDCIEQGAKKLNIGHVVRELAGLVTFMHDEILDGRVICPDPSRKVLKYRKNGVIVRDQKGKKINTQILDTIKLNYKTLYDERIKELDTLIEDPKTDCGRKAILLGQKRDIMLLEKSISGEALFRREELLDKLAIKLSEVLPQK